MREIAASAFGLLAMTEKERQWVDALRCWDPFYNREEQRDEAISLPGGSW